MQFLPPLDYGLVVFANKCRLFCTSKCHVNFIHHVKFYFRLRQLIGFAVGVSCAVAVKVRSRKYVFQVICYTPYQKSSSIKSCLPLKLVFCQGSSSIKGHLPSKGNFTHIHPPQFHYGLVVFAQKCAHAECHF